MNNFEHILDVIINKPLYLVLIVSLILMIVWSLIKKLYKLAIIFGICSVVYVVYIYIENPKDTEERIKKGLQEGAKKFENLIDESGFKIELEKGVQKGAKKIENFMDDSGFDDVIKTK